MRFKDIPGHEGAKDQLRRLADSGRIPHAILLEGPEGIGKYAIARAFAQYVNCSNKKDGDSCGICPSCVQHGSMQHIDTIHSFPYIKKKSGSATYADDFLAEFIEFVSENPYMDKMKWLEKLGKPNTQPQIYVEEASNLIKRLSYATRSSAYTIVLMWQVDKLNESASNKLLKLIEEPPGQAIIVMTTDNSSAVLPTIYSRTQRIKLKRMSDEVIAEYMSDKLGMSHEEAVSLAPLAQGSVTEAERQAKDKGQNEEFLKNFISLMRLAWQRDIHSLKQLTSEIASYPRSTLVDMLGYMSRMIRENFIANLADSNLSLMNKGEYEFSRKFAPFIHEINTPTLIQAVDDAMEDIQANANAKIVLFDMAITIILLLKK